MIKKILITGATSGIGFNFFKKNLKKNFEFYLVGRDFKKLSEYISKKKIKKKIKLINFKFEKRIKNFNFEQIPKLDYVVLAAGITRPNLIKDFNEKYFDEVIHINLFQTAKFIATLVKLKKINNKASIVTVSSISGRKMAFNFHYAYSISKAGLEAMMMSLANELGNKLIRVNAVAPGMVDTPLLKNLLQDNYYTKIDKEKYLLGKRYAYASEVSDAITFLLSTKSSFITGQTIVIDGGFTLTK